MLLATLKSIFSRPRQTPGTSFADAFALFREGHLDEAEVACAAVAGVPQADVDYLRGLIAQRRNDASSAESHFRAAVRGRENEATFRFSLGEVLVTLRRFDQAVQELEHFLALAPESDPRRARACLACAECCARLRDDPGAQRWRARALEVAGEDAVALREVADALYSDSSVEVARELLSRPALRGDSATQVRRTMMLPAIYASRQHIADVRARFDAELDALLQAPLQPVRAPEAEIGMLPFYLAYHNEDNAALMRKVCAVMRRAYPAAAAQACSARASSGRIRVGFVSNHFHGHSIGRITLGPIRDLPRERFEVCVFAIEPAQDPLKRDIERCAERYVALPNRLESVREAVSSAALDALVFADIGMHPTTYFLALHRLAPLQVAFYGHPVTTGIDTVDCYFSAAGVEIDGAERHYTERLVRAEKFYLGGYERPLLRERLSRESLGLPVSARLYACLQPAFKQHPEFDALLARILEGDAAATVVLLESRPAWRQLLEQRFSRTLGKVSARVLFLPAMSHPRFLAVLAAADVVLDPLFFGGANSSSEALSLGMPVVTLPGSHAGGRYTYALYREMGIEECIVDSPARYASLAIRIANDAEYRRALSERILERCPALFERRDIALALGEFIEAAVSTGR